MAKQKKRTFKLIPLLLTAIVLVSLIGLVIFLRPASPLSTTQDTPSSIASEDDTITVLAESPIGNDLGDCIFDDDIKAKANKDKEFTCKRYGCTIGPPGSPISYKETSVTYKNNKRIDSKTTETTTLCPSEAVACRGNPNLRSQVQTQCIKYAASGGSAACPGGTLDYADYSLCLLNAGNEPNLIDKSVFGVKLTLKNVPPKEKGTDYYYCLRTDPKGCDDDELKENTVDLKDGVLTIEKLCGAGDNKLKKDIECHLNGSDWFHQEKTYRVTFYEKPKAASPQIAQVAFYVAHMYPEVITPKTGSAELDRSFNYNALNARGSMEVTLEGRSKNQADNNNTQNSYYVRLMGVDNDYKSAPGCVYIPYGKERGSTNLALTDYLDPDTNSGRVISKLVPGNYFLVIKEGKDLSEDTKRCSEGKFTYYHIPIRVGQGGVIGPDGNLEGGKTGYIGPEIQDPFRKEIGLKDLQPTPAPVCDPEDIDTDTGYCKRIRTALGMKISTEPVAFVTDVFGLVLAIGGMAVVVFFIQAGYTILTSAGNKEKVAHAREQMTSAIMGLLFIILSISILEFIGINILHIPGFGN